MLFLVILKSKHPGKVHLAGLAMETGPSKLKTMLTLGFGRRILGLLRFVFFSNKYHFVTDFLPSVGRLS